MNSVSLELHFAHRPIFISFHCFLCSRNVQNSEVSKSPEMAIMGKRYLKWCWYTWCGSKVSTDYIERTHFTQSSLNLLASTLPNDAFACVLVCVYERPENKFGELVVSFCCFWGWSSGHQDSVPGCFTHQAFSPTSSAFQNIFHGDLWLDFKENPFCPRLNPLTLFEAGPKKHGFFLWVLYHPITDNLLSQKIRLINLNHN